MGFLSSIVSATVKTVLTPVAIAKDVVNVVAGKDIKSTEKHIKSIIKDLEKSGNL
jgi:hypothetical protein